MSENRSPEERERSDDPSVTDPSPEQQDPESSAGAEEFENDPSRNPPDDELKDLKGA